MRNPSAVPGLVEGPEEAERVARALARMQEQLSDHVTGRTRLLAGIAHDLRTPLARIRFRIEDMPARQKRALESDLSEMEAMMAAAIDFGRDASSSGPRDRLELRSLVEQVAGGMPGKRGIDVPAGDPILVEGDPLALRRLFANLIDNALRHGGSAEISLSIGQNVVQVDVADRGPGLPADELDRVFDPFYRTSATRAAGIDGSGLGLAVVRAIVRAHGGDVDLRIREGGGLVASVRLPLAPGAFT
ncbi:MAG: sensor histidine kinase [Thermaurantiacus sp.]